MSVRRIRRRRRIALLVLAPMALAACQSTPKPVVESPIIDARPGPPPPVTEMQAADTTVTPTADGRVASQPSTSGTGATGATVAPGGGSASAGAAPVTTVVGAASAAPTSAPVSAEAVSSPISMADGLRVDGRRIADATVIELPPVALADTRVVSTTLDLSTTMDGPAVVDSIVTSCPCVDVSMEPMRVERDRAVQLDLEIELAKPGRSIQIIWLRFADGSVYRFRVELDVT